MVAWTLVIAVLTSKIIVEVRKNHETWILGLFVNQGFVPQNYQGIFHKMIVRHKKSVRLTLWVYMFKTAVLYIFCSHFLSQKKLMHVNSAFDVVMSTTSLWELSQWCRDWTLDKPPLHSVLSPFLIKWDTIFSIRKWNFMGWSSTVCWTLLCYKRSKEGLSSIFCCPLWRWGTRWIRVILFLFTSLMAEQKYQEDYITLSALLGWPAHCISWKLKPALVFWQHIAGVFMRAALQDYFLLRVKGSSDAQQNTSIITDAAADVIKRLATTNLLCFYLRDS